MKNRFVSKLIIFVAISIFFLLFGCRSRPVMPPVEQHTITVNDSIYELVKQLISRETLVSDKVTVNDYERYVYVVTPEGDTIGRDHERITGIRTDHQKEEKEHKIEKDSLGDRKRSEKKDSVPYPIVRSPDRQTVDNGRKAWWEEGLMWIGGIVLLATVIVTAIKLKKK